MTRRRRLPHPDAIASCDAGVLTGGTLELSGGFWFPLEPGDADEDGLVSLTDFDLFASCLSGPGGQEPDGACRIFDVDGNGRVDLSDFAEIQASFTGS